MKKFSFFSVALLAAVLFTSCEPKDPTGGNNTPSKIGVKINGVVWSPYNVDAFGTFVASSEKSGMLYQWNRSAAWNAIDSLVTTGWSNTVSESETWTVANDPSPKGWRVPTIDELKTLLDTVNVKHQWTTEKDVIGSRFTDKTSGNSIFMPAAGERKPSDGTLQYVGIYGNYWSNSVKSSMMNGAYVMCFTETQSSAEGGAITNFGYSVRCVKE